MRDPTLGVMDVILVIVGPSKMHFSPFDDFDRVEFPVPPTAHDASSNLKWQDI